MQPFAREDVDQRAEATPNADACHPTCTRFQIASCLEQVRHDFMNLNQAAHGEREFGFI
jgi:hypothetical protein